MGDPDQADNFDRLMEEMGKLRKKSTISTAGNSTGGSTLPPTPWFFPDEAIVRQLSGGERRRVALCRALLERPDLLSRRTDKPPRRRNGQLARGLCATIPVR